MRICIFILLQIFLESCDSAQIKFTEGDCIKHNWSTEVFKIEQIKPPEIELTSLTSGGKKSVSTRNTGYKVVSCLVN